MCKRTLHFHKAITHHYTFGAYQGDGLTDRLFEANEIWYQLMSMQAERLTQENPLANRNMLFLLFGRFVHELVLDRALCGELLDYIDRQMREGK